ncbi:MAG: hypothetical protein IJ668_09080 [Selenomonadaceae bacterium]|nr:hypothetical protein [Selenomonadaceae bacterium]MBR1580636.1 hypothetical protein [Selenomonadaceae bacterium]
MGIIGKMLHNSIDFGGRVADAVGDAFNRTGEDIGESAAQAALAMKISVVDNEIKECYEEIGRRIVLHIRQTRSSPTMEVFGEPLRAAMAKIVYKEQLESELAERERLDALLSGPLRDMKLQLDRALASGVITQQEYDTKLLNAARTGSFGG